MIDKDDRGWLIRTTLLVLVITSLPYLLGFMRQGGDWRFTGFVFGVEDGNSYIAKMLSGTYGNWLFSSPYTAMPQQGMFAFLPYLLLGKLAFNPEVHDQLVVLYQVFRWLAGGLLAFAVYQFSQLFLIEKRSRRIATIIIIVGGGLGWLGWLAFPSNWTDRLPLEVYSPEAFGFLSFLGLPHLAAARAFLLFGFVAFLRSDEDQNPYLSAVLGGVCWLAAGFFQPLTVVVGYGILGFYFLLNVFLQPATDWRERLPLLKKSLIILLVSSPWLVYNYFSFSNDQYLKVWVAQNIISSPPLQDYLWSYGLFLLAGIPAIVHIIRKREMPGILLIAWLICAASLAYFPYNVQRRFIDGVWIALVILVVSSYEFFVKTKSALLYKGILSVTVAAPILVMLVTLQGAWLVSTPVYRPAAEVLMFEAVSKTAIPENVILCSYETGNAIPAWTPVRVMAGHGPESANLKEVRPEIFAFFSGEKDLAWQRDFLSRNRVQFIVSGPLEKTLGNWELLYGSSYNLIYSVEGYSIFRVEGSHGE